jgi:hypothetical protein
MHASVLTFDCLAFARCPELECSSIVLVNLDDEFELRHELKDPQECVAAGAFHGQRTHSP